MGSRPLLVFAMCSFLYDLADARLLTLVGQKLGSDRQGAGLVLTSALVVAAQLGRFGASILVGKRGEVIGHRLLMAIGFAAAGAGRTDDGGGVALLAFGGIGSGLFAGLTPIWLADATRGGPTTWRKGRWVRRALWVRPPAACSANLWSSTLVTPKHRELRRNRRSSGDSAVVRPA